MVFSLVRTPLPNGPRRVAVRSVDALTPTYLRIALEGDFADFESRGADDHLRLFFVPDDVDAAELAELRPFPSREYTPVSWSADELTLDVVVHGEGPGSNWAASATPGNGAMVGGPRGSQVLDGRPDHWLLAGDRTALPAIRRFAAQAASGVPVDVVVIAEDPADEQAISSPGDLRVTWVRDLDALIAALGAAQHRDGDGFAFVAAEQSVVKPARAALVAAGFDLERSIVKGYWKRGEAEYHAPH